MHGNQEDCRAKTYLERRICQTAIRAFPECHGPGQTLGMAKAGWGERIKTRARELGLTDAAVARALDLPQRRYSAYANETREPDFATLLRICRVLRTTPNAILGVGPHETLPAGDAEVARMEAAVRGLGEADRVRAFAVLEVLAAHPTASDARLAPRSIRKPSLRDAGQKLA